ncbi:hypothetical protein PHMEG_00029709 [Phytophthora megakarya]|uniref:FAR1 domain-containing protein n=1 Tax=Phytophthora megakarya TaxID=4795 RepID=A0A225V3I3_9STRA|nr:hypothetical protein PHMEG_00029709 [Phytophthora megakarya]
MVLPTTQATLPTPSDTDPQRSWILPCIPESFFNSAETAKAAVNAFAARHGYFVVTKSSLNDNNKKPRRLILACDRHGSRQLYIRSSEVTHHRNGKSRRCGCPMQMNVMRIRDAAGQEKWQIQHRGMANVHNHPPITDLATHPQLRRATWTDTSRRIMETDARAGVPTKETLTTLALEAPGVIVTKEDIFNERRKLMAKATENNELPSRQADEAFASVAPQPVAVHFDAVARNIEQVATDLLHLNPRYSLPLSSDSEVNGSIVVLPSEERVGETIATPVTENSDSSPRLWDLPCLPESSFASPEAARAAVNAFGSGNGYAVVHMSTRYDAKKQPRRIILACDRHGTNRARASASSSTPSYRRKKPSRKCGCPMRMNLVRTGSGTTERWQVQHRGIARQHNHAPSSGPSAHPILRRESRTEEVRGIIAADANAGIPVSQTLVRLAAQAPGMLLTSRDVYNQRYQMAHAIESAPPITIQASEATPRGTSTTDHQEMAAQTEFSQEAAPTSVSFTPPSDVTQNDNNFADQVESPQRAWNLPCLPESSFESPETARAAVNAFASRHGYAVVHRSTRYDNRKQPCRLILACDRHGENKPRTRTTPNATVIRRRKPTRRCGCPMRINLVRCRSDGQWQVQHRGIAHEHNHPPSADPSAHPILRRESRTEAVRQIIADDTQAGLPVSHTLSHVAVESPSVILTARDVYNLRRRLEQDK